ncbi:hypothetical protein GCM10023205_79350 [Yinghuangia aomiensis]|uniref:Uncharacterized protein n=1 Tax=Yinghuangia aomiensis TaxID=676205 RepID=A0ABP9ICG6_9ACTN
MTSPTLPTDKGWRFPATAIGIATRKVDAWGNAVAESFFAHTLRDRLLTAAAPMRSPQLDGSPPTMHDVVKGFGPVLMRV